MVNGPQGLRTRGDIDKPSVLVALATVVLLLGWGVAIAGLPGRGTFIRDDGATVATTFGGGNVTTSPLLSWDDLAGRDENISWKFWVDQITFSGGGGPPGCPGGGGDIIVNFNPGPRIFDPMQDLSFVSDSFDLPAEPGPTPVHTDLLALDQGGSKCPVLDDEMMQPFDCPFMTICVNVAVPPDMVEFTIHTDPGLLASEEPVNLTFKWETTTPSVDKARIFAFSRDVEQEDLICGLFSYGENCTSPVDAETNLAVFDLQGNTSGELNYTITPGDIIAMALMPDGLRTGIAIEFSGFPRAGIVPSEGVEAWKFDFVMYGLDPEDLGDVVVPTIALFGVSEVILIVTFFTFGAITLGPEARKSLTELRRGK